jgi:hypothetical protein
MKADGVIRTEMDAPVDKIRKRFTTVVKKFSLNLILTSDQVDILDEFYDSNASVQWEWFHPRTQAPANCRFRSEPAYSGIDRVFACAFEMEIVPS